MSQGARFRYPLTPILLTRQWELDALLLELGEHNAALAQQQERAAQLQARLDAAGAEFHALSGASGTLSVQHFALLSQFIGDLALRLRAEQAEVERLAGVRDEAAARVLAGQRGVEAVEKHRDEMKKAFVKQRLSGEFKIADDQWNTLQTGMSKHAT